MAVEAVDFTGTKDFCCPYDWNEQILFAVYTNFLVFICVVFDLEFPVRFAAMLVWKTPVDFPPYHEPKSLKEYT